jgi:hypothetical protein
MGARDLTAEPEAIRCPNTQIKQHIVRWLVLLAMLLSVQIAYRKQEHEAATGPRLDVRGLPKKNWSHLNTSAVQSSKFFGI